MAFACRGSARTAAAASVVEARNSRREIDPDIQIPLFLSGIPAGTNPFAKVLSITHLIAAGHSRRGSSFFPVKLYLERLCPMPPLEGRYDASLIQIVDDALASTVQRSGRHLACRPGCTQCCHGIFPISQQDAARLREGLHLLVNHDPQRAARIAARVEDSLQQFAPLFPGDPSTGILSKDYEDSTLFADDAEGAIGENEPCPVLDPAIGTCDLYQHRPIVCRTFGPPMRTPDGDLATCELCYITATTEEIAACELDPTIPAQESASNAVYNASHSLQGETIVAFALRDAADIQTTKR
jgi:Fe-S-cluster containining protein